MTLTAPLSALEAPGRFLARREARDASRALSAPHDAPPTATLESAG